MNAKKSFLAAAALLLAQMAGAAQIDWAGLTWQVRAGAGNPCASGLWNEKGAWTDSNGWLHLKLARQPSGEFACVEVTATGRFGFGDYAFEVEGPIGAIDKNVVLGLFLYPPRDVGPDGTNEIDIEIARWGLQDAPQVHYTAWYRSRKGSRSARTQVPDDLTRATFGMTWRHELVRWESSLPRAVPAGFDGDLADQPQMLKINLWLFRSLRPSDGREVEFVIKWLRYP